MNANESENVHVIVIDCENVVSSERMNENERMNEKLACFAACRKSH